MSKKDKRQKTTTCAKASVVRESKMAFSVKRKEEKGLK